MNYLSNIHTHTTYCDGVSTAAEMAAAALGKNFVSLGFSGHAPVEFKQDWCMSREGNCAYVRELRELQTTYAGRLEILIGVEQDYFSIAPLFKYDYIIGSVHYLYLDGSYVCVDDTEERIKANVRQYFGGDFYRFAAAYYEKVADVVNRTKADVIGHFDLIAKFNEGMRLFDENDSRYRKSALATLATLRAADKPLEINTGAVYRSWRSAPYPAPFLLKAWRELGGEIVLTSDSHQADSLGFMFGEAAELARACGFREALLLRRQGWTTVEL